MRYELAGGANPGPASDFAGEVEVVDRGGVLVRSPLAARQHPHQFEFVAVGVGAVDALGGPVARLTAVGTRLEQGRSGGGELVDRVELPGEVVQPDAAAALRAAGGADTEQAEVVMVPLAWQSEERGVGAWFAGDDLHAEQVGVEAQRPFQIGDEQHGVVEADG